MVGLKVTAGQQPKKSPSRKTAVVNGASGVSQRVRGFVQIILPSKNRREHPSQLTSVIDLLTHVCRAMFLVFPSQALRLRGRSSKEPARLNIAKGIA